MHDTVDWPDPEGTELPEARAARNSRQATANERDGICGATALAG
jgi:hypothetical protein